MDASTPNKRATHAARKDRLVTLLASSCAVYCHSCILETVRSTDDTQRDEQLKLMISFTLTVLVDALQVQLLDTKRSAIEQFLQTMCAHTVEIMRATEPQLCGGAELTSSLVAAFVAASLPAVLSELRGNGQGSAGERIH